MVSKQRYTPWLWIPSLFVAEEIPSAVVIYVALIMFLQFGADETMAAVYSGLLFLPWVFKSYLYTKVQKASTFKWRIHVVELLLFVCLMGIAVYLTEYRVKAAVLFLFMFVLSFFCAWHELLSRIYYSRMLTRREQDIYGNTKMISSQISLVVTYGLLIIVAGFFEVFFRSYQKAWAMESALVAGGFLLFCVVNAIVLQNPRHLQHYRYESFAHAVKNELHVLDRIRQKPHVLPVLISLFFLLLPQALMFNTRVFFLLASADEGGLDCSVQDVGFAQGTIGVIAFSFGLGLGRALIRRYGERKMFWTLALLLTLSPLFYMLMAIHPQPGNLWLICCVTFFAQLFFGVGLNVCTPFVRYISGYRYRNTLNYLYVPLVATAMMLPMMASGWLAATMGYPRFFLLNTLMAPLAWGVMALCRIQHILIPSRNQTTLLINNEDYEQ